MRLLHAFLVRDFFTETSYRTSFIVSIMGIFFNILVFYFLSEFISAATIPALDILRLAQTTGTPEAMMMTPASLPSIISGSAAWSYFFATLRVLVCLLRGTLIFGVSFSGANDAAALFSDAPGAAQRRLIKELAQSQIAMANASL